MARRSAGFRKVGNFVPFVTPLFQRFDSPFIEIRGEIVGRKILVKDMSRFQGEIVKADVLRSECGGGGNDRLYYKEFDTPTQNNGVAEGMDDETYWSGFGSLAYCDFSLQSAFVHREKANPTAQYTYTTFNDPRLRTSVSGNR